MLLLAFSWNVIAADSVNLGVTGNIIASPCVFNGGSANLDINLGNIQATNMATPGSTSDPVPFNLQFTQCPAGTRSVTGYGTLVLPYFVTLFYSSILSLVCER